MIAAFVVGLLIFLARSRWPAEERSARERVAVLLDPSRALHVDFGLLIDPLSLTFVLLITGVGSLIHIYSIGYMAHDPDRRQVLRVH